MKTAEIVRDWNEIEEQLMQEEMYLVRPMPKEIRLHMNIISLVILLK